MVDFSLDITSVLNTYPNLEWIDTPQPGCLLDFAGMAN